MNACDIEVNPGRTFLYEVGQKRRALDWVSLAVGVAVEVGVMVTVGGCVGVCEGVGVMLAVGSCVGREVGLPWSGF